MKHLTNRLLPKLRTLVKTFLYLFIKDHHVETENEIISVLYKLISGLSEKSNGFLFNLRKIWDYTVFPLNHSSFITAVIKIIKMSQVE